MPVVVTPGGPDPELLRLRVRALSPSPVVVHVGRQYDAEEFTRSLAGCDNVVWLDDDQREVVRAAGFSMTRTLFTMMERALELTGADDYICAVRSHDYPLRDLEGFVDHLRAERLEYIRYYRVARYPWTNFAQVGSLHAHDVRWPAEPWHRGGFSAQLDAEALLRRTELLHGRWTRRPLKADSPVARGDATWALSRSAVAHVLGRRTPERDRVMRRMAKSAHMYVHTLIATSPYHARTPAGGYEDPECGHDGYLPTMAEIPVYGPAPTPTPAELPRLRHGGYPFVRGVRLPQSRALVDQLAAERGAP